MTISFNGRPMELPQALTLDGLLRHVGLGDKRLALERNRELVPRRDWTAVSVEEGDRIEVVEFVGGG